MFANDTIDKRQAMKLLSTQNGLIAGFATIVTLMVLITVFSVHRMTATHEQFEHHLHTDMDKLALSTELRSIARERTLILHRILYVDDPFERDESEMQLYHYASRFAQARLKLLSMELSDEEKELLHLQGERAAKAVPLARTIVELVKQDRLAEANDLFVHSSVPAQNSIIAVLESLYDVQYRNSRIASEKAQAAYENTRLWTYILASGLIFLGILISIVVIKRARQAERERAVHLEMINKTNEELVANSNELLIARDAAQQASKSKSQFLANMSHELRTPMNAIMGYSELLAEDAETIGNQAMLDDISKIQGSAKHLLTLINQILDLSKVESGKVDVHAEPFKVKKLLSDVLDIIQPMTRNYDNTLDVDIDKSLDLMISDQTMLRQILFNLLSNAFKFTENGQIYLKVDSHEGEHEDELKIQIKDTGIGISETQLERIFSPFIQADNSTTRRYGGTGLGLALTKRYCELLRGSIEVESTPGKGSTFTVILPLIYQQDSI